MSTAYADNNPVQSLVERKKQQWAREREELADLNERAPWGSRESLQLYDRPYIKTRYVTKYQKENDYLRRDSSATPSRRPSLPPLYKNQNIAYTSNEKLDKEMGGETSGYGSDNPNQTPEHFPQATWNHHQTLGGYESSSSGREDRLKWGERGMHLGKFWEPKDMSMESFAKSTDTPGWVKRGLERDSELIVSNTSPAESPEQDYIDRPCTSSSSSQTRCYIRGQNVPVEPLELAERERKRQIALAHQEAIRQQLEEREKRRQEERARQLREEFEEERRIAREQEIERQRKEQEERLRDEKYERDRKRKEALREAIAIAEKEAREEKSKKFARQDVNINENVVEIEKAVKTLPQDDVENRENEKNKSIIVVQESKEVDKIQEDIKHAVTTVSTEPNNNNNIINTSNNSNNNTHNNNNCDNTNNNSNSSKILNNNIKQQQSQTQDNLAVVLQNPATDAFQNLQFAILVPALNNLANNSLPIAVPLPLYSDRSTINTTRTENRLLTPTQYRNRKNVCDSSTQTDFIDYNKPSPDDPRERYVREKLANLEICFETHCRKERRSRSEIRENVGERPKWGVNRPPTRYLKQSEKDPLYQRRKLRQKMRQIKVYDDKCNSPHSSDDSQTASPRTYRKKGYTEKRHSRALWRKNEQLFAENVRVYQTEIIPLESDKDHIYLRTKASSHHCCCRCKKENDKCTDHVKVVDILKIDHNTPRECLQYMDENKNKLPDCTKTNLDDGCDVLDKLSNIHQGLMLKQDQWDDGKNHILYSPPSRHP